MTRSRQTADWGSRAGLAKVIPSSVAVGSGSSSVDSLGKVSFTNCSSVSLNDVFSATYDNYRILIQCSVGTSVQLLGFRLRVSGSDVTSNYNSGIFGKRIDGSAGTLELSQTTYFVLGYVTATTTGYTSQYVFDIQNPFKSEWTFMSGNATFDRSGTAPYTANIGCYNYNDTSYTGFTLFPAANNIYGKITVYGYN